MAKPKNGARGIKALLIAAVLVGIVSWVYFNSPLAPGKSTTAGQRGDLVEMGEVELEVDKPIAIDLGAGRSGSLTLLSERPLNGGITVRFKLTTTNLAENAVQRKIESVTTTTALTPGIRNIFSVRDTPFAVTPKVKTP
jgi:hypothetical protein